MALFRETNMPYVRLGKSGLRVSKLILGCMSYGSTDWVPWVVGEKEGIEHIKTAFFEYGINTFDTANTYSNGASERILGKAIKELNLPREEIVVLTKVYFPVGKAEGNPMKRGWGTDFHSVGYVNENGLSRKHIFGSVKASLERLGLDYIDLLQCHRFDYTTPIEETMQALHDVVKSGMVRYIGMSSCHAHQFWQMQSYAVQHNLTPFISMQNLYNALYREEEREMLPTLKHFGVGCIPWSPLARGALARPLSQQKETKRGESDQFIGLMAATDADKKTIELVEELAKKYNKTMAQIATAYVLAKPDITAPIIGSTRIEAIKELVDAIEIKLTPEEVKSIDDLYVPKQIIGHS